MAFEEDTFKDLVVILKWQALGGFSERNSLHPTCPVTSPQRQGPAWGLVSLDSETSPIF